MPTYWSDEPDTAGTFPVSSPLLLTTSSSKHCPSYISLTTYFNMDDILKAAGCLVVLYWTYGFFKALQVTIWSINQLVVYRLIHLQDCKPCPRISTYVLSYNSCWSHASNVMVEPGAELDVEASKNRFVGSFKLAQILNSLLCSVLQPEIRYNFNGTMASWTALILHFVPLRLPTATG